MGRERWIESGEILAVEGEPSGCFCYWTVRFNVPVGDRQVPWLTLSSVPFGQELILLNQPYLATARATSRATYWSLILKLSGK